MAAYRLTLNTGTASNAIGHVGGSPRVPTGTEWPRCRMCNDSLVAFLDLVLPDSDSCPFVPGSRVQVFACRQHDDIAGPIYSDYSPFESASRNQTLPHGYWNLHDGHYLLRLVPPTEATIVMKAESRLLPQVVSATETVDEGEDGLKLFGEPNWLQDAEPHDCVCGAPMKLLLQIPEGFGFAKAAGAERQANSFSNDEYCIFLGNQTYLLGCTNQCDPLAVWPILQG